MRLPLTLLLAASPAEMAVAAFNAFNMYDYGEVVTALGLSPECTLALYWAPCVLT